MRPMPTMPSVRPARSWPEVAERLPGLPLAGRARTACPSTMRRAAAISRQKAMSAVASVSTPGVLPTRDAARGGGGHVDVVEADREVADDLEPRRGVEQRGVDPVGQQRHQAVAVGDLLPQHLVRRRQRLGPDLGVAVLLDLVQPGFGNRRVTNTFGLVMADILVVGLAVGNYWMARASCQCACQPSRCTGETRVPRRGDLRFAAGR